MPNDLIFYEFSRPKVEAGDFSHFLRLYGHDALPTGRRLRAICGAFVFAIDGYDEDQREIHSIPEVRAFYRSFCAAWPYWLYFGNVETEELKMMVLACLPSLSSVKVAEKTSVSVAFDGPDLAAFLQEYLPPMRTLCMRAGMFEHLIEAREQAVFDYFGMPGASMTGDDSHHRE